MLWTIYEMQIVFGTCRLFFNEVDHLTVPIKLLCNMLLSLE